MPVMTRGEPHDPLPFTPHDHDVRIVRGTWVYYVRGVKKSEPLRSNDFTDASGIVETILSLLVGWTLARWWDRQTTWKVGVMRYPIRPGVAGSGSSTRSCSLTVNHPRPGSQSWSTT
jgi:hypothetical protein